MTSRWFTGDRSPNRGGFRLRIAVVALCLFALGTGASAGELDITRPNAAQPFSRLRETTLGYNGPADDIPNLTEIRIGWFGPTEADDPATGGLWWSAHLAIEEANAQIANSGLPASDFSRLPFRLVPRWTADPWGSGITLLTRMVFDEQPLALLGSVDSATTHLAEQVVAKAQLPLVSPIATDKTATLAGVSWMFSCAPGDDAIARVLADAIQAEIKGPEEKIVLLATTDHESRMSAREVVRELLRRGRGPDFRFDVTPGAADTSKQLQAVAGARPAVVLIIAGVDDAARLTQAVRAQTDTALIFGNQSMSRRRFSVLAGPAAEGVRFPLLFVPDPADANSHHFIERFTAAHRGAPDYTEALTYDATRMLVEAIRRAGPNRARIREALTQLSPWSGIAGTIDFDGTGQNRRADLRLGTIRNGTLMPDVASLVPSGHSLTLAATAVDDDRQILSTP